MKDKILHMIAFIMMLLMAVSCIGVIDDEMPGEEDIKRTAEITERII